MNHSSLLSQHSMTDAVVCASCLETYRDRVAELCLQHQVQKAFRKAGDTLNKRRGKGWIPKWEAKVVMATVTKAQTLNTNKARILCIAGDKNCGAEMARQPARVRAIKTGMANQVYRVRVELIEIREFLERYLGKIFFWFGGPNCLLISMVDGRILPMAGNGYLSRHFVSFLPFLRLVKPKCWILKSSSPSYFMG